MAFFDRMTNQAFRHSESGEVAYIPPLLLGSARLLPTAHDEAVMRRTVRKTMRYAVLIACPTIVLAQIYVRMEGPSGLRGAGILALLFAVLLLPAEVWLHQLSKRFARIDGRIAKAWVAEPGDGPTLSAAVALSGFTVWIGLMGLMVVFGFAANYFHL